MHRDLPTVVLQTGRLRLRHMAASDAAFMLDLLNEPSYLRFIGDRGVRTLDAARDYILGGPADMLRRLGFSFYVVELEESGSPVGVCGLAKRDFLDDVDIGYAFASPHWGQGYAYEAASAVLAHAKNDIGLKRIVATVRPDNAASIRLLEKLGLRFERSIEPAGHTPELHLFGMALA
ncbi:GNAT family N-acetyltransferase [Massilia niabensis]|uniref:GNAT family N-acetyltransferase n=1 Tax=Massilia niabensis TaxID=544910 RepID=A0ABW0L5J8_9BURK